MTSATFAKTLTAFIFSAQLAIASGPTLLSEEIEQGRVLVSVSQAAAKAEPTSSSWWGMGAFWSAAKNTVETLLSPPKIKETTWEAQWNTIVGHISEQTVNHHKGGFWAANGVAKEILNNPQAKTEFEELRKRLNVGVDLLEERDYAQKIDHAENLSLFDDVKKLNLGGFASLIYDMAQNNGTSPQFINLLSYFYQDIAEKNKILKDERFFKDGALMAQCLWDISKMRHTEEQLPLLKQRVLAFYNDYDGGNLSPYSKRQLDQLGILYFADVNKNLKSANSSFSYTDTAKATGLILLVLGGGFLQGVAAQVTQPAMVTSSCRGTAIECLSAFGPAVGFGTQISYLLQDSFFNVTINDMKQALSSAYIDTRVDISGLRDNSIYAEVSTWNNAASPNITRFLNSNTEATKGCDYAPLSGTQHYETTFNNVPIGKSNLVTTTVAGSINPYYWELPISGDMWLFMAQHPDGTIVGSIVFRPAAGTPYVQGYANLVMTPQRAASRVQPTALASVYVPSGTPARITSQQGFTADQFQASYSTQQVGLPNCQPGSVSIEQFLANANTNLNAIIQCLQNSGYNPLSCRSLTNPLGSNGYVQLMTYYMLSGALHETLVSGTSYTHDIYTSTGAASMSRMRHTFDWKNQGMPTTTTTAVAQSLSSRQGTLLASGAMRKFAVFYYDNTNNPDPAEPAIVINVGENGSISYGAYMGTNRCPTRKRDVEEEQPQSKIKVFEKKSHLNIKEFETRQAESSTYTESFLRFFGLGSSSIPLPRSDMKVEDWYRFRKEAPSVDGWAMRRFQFADNGQEHDIHFSEEGDTFAVTHYYQNITSVKPEHKKWIVH